MKADTVRVLRALVTQGLEALPADWTLVRLENPVARRADTHLLGAVDGYDAIVERFAQALQLDKPVLLWVRSPGGDVLGLSEAASNMALLRVTYSAPVYAVVHADASDAARQLAETVADRLLLRGERHVRRSRSGQVCVMEPVEEEEDDGRPRTA